MVTLEDDPQKTRFIDDKNRVFSSVSAFRNGGHYRAISTRSLHYTTFFGNRRVFCGSCSLDFGSQEALQEHLATSHPNEKPPRRPSCSRAPEHEARAPEVPAPPPPPPAVPFNPQSSPLFDASRPPPSFLGPTRSPGLMRGTSFVSAQVSALEGRRSYSPVAGQSSSAQVPQPIPTLAKSPHTPTSLPCVSSRDPRMRHKSFPGRGSGSPLLGRPPDRATSNSDLNLGNLFTSPNPRNDI